MHVRRGVAFRRRVAAVWLGGMIGGGLGMPVCHGLPAQSTTDALAASISAVASSSIESSAAVPARDGTYFLQLAVNKLDTGRIFKVVYRSPHFYMRAADLAQVSIQVSAEPSADVAVDLLPGASVEYDGERQRIDVTVRADTLPEQTIGDATASTYEYAKPQVSLGALFNYDVYASVPSEGVRSISAYLEQRVFGDKGVFVNDMLYRESINGPRLYGAPRWVRYDTQFTWGDDERLLTWTVGDQITNQLGWSSAVRMAGVSVGRDYSMRPDIVTYPLPQFAGQAQVPTTVDLFVNGSKLATTTANPGPFVINRLPYISGAGEATVVTSDALGRPISTTIPFYVAPNLLRPGMSTYGFSLGALRRDYGVNSFSYGPVASTGFVQYGLTDYLTAEARFEAASKLWLGGIGANVRLGVWGVANASFAQSHSEGNAGAQLTAGYAYSALRWSVAIQHTQRTDRFRDIATYDIPSAYSTLFSAYAKRIDQATFSYSLGSDWGALGAGYFNIETAYGAVSTMTNVSYSRRFIGNSSMYVSVNKGSGQNNLFAQVLLVFAFDGYGSASASLNRMTDGRFSEYVAYDRSAPTDNGIGVNLGYGGGAQRYRQGSLTLKNRYFQARAGAYGSGRVSEANGWADMSGSLIFMDRDLFVSNRIMDSFAVVSTQGYSDIPITYENQTVGKTDRSGHLLVPWGISYYPAKYAIDPMSLPLDARSSVIERRAAMRRGSGALLVFPVEKIIAARIVLVTERGEKLPPGTPVTLMETGDMALVGIDGVVYFESLAESNHVSVELSNGRSCEARFSIDSRDAVVRKIGPVICRREIQAFAEK